MALDIVSSSSNAQVFKSSASKVKSAEVFPKKDIERLPLPGGMSNSDDAVKVTISQTSPADALNKKKD